MFGVFLGAVLVLLIIWFKLKSFYWEKRGIPGPKPWPLVGNLGAQFMGKKTMGGVMRDIYKKYEGYPFVGVFRATTPVLLVRDPELVNLILVKDFKSFRNNEIPMGEDKESLFSKNPFVLKDKEWKDTRAMLTPGLTSGRMKNIYPIIRAITENFIKYIENHPTATTDGIETRALTKRLTLDFVAKAAFGIDGKSFESYDDISEFNKMVNEFMSPGTWFSLYFTAVTICPWISNFISVSFVSKSAETKLLNVISDVVKYRRENNIQANDYLQFLIDLGKDRKISDFEITAHASTLFIDGYETSSLVLSFFLLNLARNPKYQEKIRDEIKKYEAENNGELTYEAVHEMTWLNACFFETLRVTPPVDVLAKKCNEPFEYTSGDPEFKKMTIKFVTGDIVMLPYGLTSRDEKYFKDADKFIPERMLSKDTLHKTAFFPFGDGPRNCIGQRYGMMQVKLGAAQILKHFEVEISPRLKQPIKYFPFHFMNEVQGGFWIRYKKVTA